MWRRFENIHAEARAKVGRLLQSFKLPVELSGLTMSEQLEVKKGHFIETSFVLSD